ncbi:glutathione S-transferase [Dokdonella sp.]|uniref:glutathione S-transferase family protein n=1 Tax=Dokdonella sp. TaxID=2291710 RepID=UPI002F3FCE28
MAIVVHHLNDSRSQRVLWLLEELGLPYEIVPYRRDPRTMLAPETLRRVHPLGKAPVVVDDGRVLAESGAIVEYLAERYGGTTLVPVRDSADWLRYRYWMHYAEGSAMPPLLLKLVFDRVEGARMPFFARPIARGIVARVRRGFVDPQLALHLDYLERELAARAWFTGDAFGAADIQMSFPIEAAAGRAGLDATRPSLWRWLERVQARPAYRRALERGGGYAYARPA